MPAFEWTQHHEWASLISAVVMGSSAVAMKGVGAPWVRDAVKHVLEAMHEHAFGKEQHREHFYDRVTLFRYSPWCWKFWIIGWRMKGGFLIPYERSGHFTGKPSVVFRAPKDDPDLAEGVAGTAFVSGATLTRTGLPDVSKKNNPTEADFEKYASETWVTKEWLKKERSTARSLLAMRVVVSGRPWGVIVVDTRSDNIPNPDTVIASYTLVAKVLGELLERS